MSRKRKPTRKPIAAAAECLYWRATVVLEMMQGLKQPPQMLDPIKRLQTALDDFEASREPAVREPESALHLLACNACGGSCTTRTDGYCNRCYDAQDPATPKLMFAEMQS